ECWRSPEALLPPHARRSRDGVLRRDLADRGWRPAAGRRSGRARGGDAPSRQQGGRADLETHRPTGGFTDGVQADLTRVLAATAGRHVLGEQPGLEQGTAGVEATTRRDVPQIGDVPLSTCGSIRSVSGTTDSNAFV